MHDAQCGDFRLLRGSAASCQINQLLESEQREEREKIQSDTRTDEETNFSRNNDVESFRSTINVPRSLGIQHAVR